MRAMTIPNFLRHLPGDYSFPYPTKMKRTRKPNRRRPCQMNVYLDRDELQSYRDAARRANMSLSGWVRKRLSLAARK
jgi:hypothetical protein